MKCGLLGKTLGHSYSPQIHSFLGDYSYDLFEKQPEEIASFFKKSDFSGINVTIPYKKDVIPYCDELSDCAKKVGAVNTIVRRSDGTLIGHNTDYYGFSSMVSRTGLSLSGKKVLVLGSGGASVTVVEVLKEMQANVIVISRSGTNNYDNLSLHSDAAAIVNTTPVGMYPNNGISPIDLNLFSNLEGVLDLIYNPARTQLLLDAEKRGIIYENGLWMLIAQAKESAEWFLGKEIDNDIINHINTVLSKQMQNIVLIGMPGCGKSTVGKQLALELSKKFVDADEEIERTAQMSIPDIFQKYGEEYFREIETRVLQELGKQSGLIIATGGGCVTKSFNYPLLHQNGTVIWIKREIANLSTIGRPLSISGKLEEMYYVRRPMYEYFSDFSVQNNHSVDETVFQIMKGYNGNEDIST